MMPFDRHTDCPMQRPSLVFEKTLVGDFLGEHVLEAIQRIGHHSQLLDDAGVLQTLERSTRIATAGSVAQDLPCELPPDYRSDAHDVASRRVETIEPRANHGLNAVGQLQIR